jgi:selenide, water dikinase
MEATKNFSEVRLTQYSHGAGCGCKIAPAVLDKILHSTLPKQSFPNLLVGNESKDDAAVFDLGNGTAIISTTDFFMPIVDDAFTFGAIASVNAISDVYAMGGTPLLAVAILGWPVEKIPTEVAQRVLDGAREVCRQANIPLAGGHSIDSPEPIFGLAVTGQVDTKNLKRNNTAQVGDVLYLTKPIGVGMVTTALKRGLAVEKDFEEAVGVMSTLNSFGATLGTLGYVTALTDVTGFGLLGHLLEVCEGSGLSAEVEFGRVPKLTNLAHYLSNMIYPDNTMRNWNSYQNAVDGITMDSLLALCDPQTSGGLLICVRPEKQMEFEGHASTNGLTLTPMGKLVPKADKSIYVK